GFMANQLNNITFEGEKEATLQNLAALGQYVSIDQQMRQLVKGGKYQEAIVIALGNEPNKSTWAFWQLLQANNKVFDINDQEFKQAIETAQKGTQGIETTASIVLISVSLMTLFGLMPRLKEYSA
ncbi:MAG: hypothetical protein ACKPE3_32420, partial [Sphaerospermopsis kisseleviana]